jgi:hypothetical protein
MEKNIKKSCCRIFKAADLQKIAEKICRLANISKSPSKHNIVEGNRNDTSKCSYFNIIALKTNSSLFQQR